MKKQPKILSMPQKGFYIGVRKVKTDYDLFVVSRICKRIPKYWYSGKELFEDVDFVRISSCGILPLKK